MCEIGRGYETLVTDIRYRSLAYSFIYFYGQPLAFFALSHIKNIVTDVLEEFSPADVLHDEEDSVLRRERVLEVHQEWMPRFIL